MRSWVAHPVERRHRAVAVVSERRLHPSHGVEDPSAPQEHARGRPRQQRQGHAQRAHNVDHSL